MIVGEGPGADEDVKGRHFVGRAGKLLDKFLEDAGIRRSDIRVTNTVRCRPTAGDVGAVRNRAPTSDEIRACDLWTAQEYRFVRPGAVVCLGIVPAHALISKTLRIGTDRKRWHVGRDGIPSLITYHPAYVLRLSGDNRRHVESQIMEDLRMAAERIAG
jgi:DNA polymerase